MKIAFDLDSVLNNLMDHWVRWVQENGDPDFSEDKVTAWQTSDFTCIGKKVYDYLRIPGVFGTLDPVPGARSVTNWLANRGHELFMISSSISSSWPDKVEWAKANVPAIPPRNLVSASCKGLFGVDVLVDDGLHNFAGFKGEAIIMDHPWNRDEQTVATSTMTCSAVHRIHSLTELPELIEGLIEQGVAQ